LETSSQKDSNPRPQAVIHADLDGAKHIYQHHNWAWDYKDDSLFVSGLSNLLNFFDYNEVKATLFTIAEDLQNPQKRDLLEDAASRGHEIASHSLTEKERQIIESRELLEKHLGIEVQGFRAPAYSIDRECLELLEKYNYEYDSSVFPNANFANLIDTLSISEKPFALMPGSNLFELPLPQYKPAPFPFHPCYSLLLGRKYFDWGFNRFRKKSLPLIFLFHLTDFSEPLPTERLRGLASKIYTLSHISLHKKMQKCEYMIKRVKKEYETVTTNELINGYKRKNISS